MHRITHADAALRETEQGQTMAEYAMVLSVITLAIMLTVTLIGDSAGALIGRLVNVLS